MDGVRGVVMIRRRELPELRPEFGGQVPLVEGEPAVGYGWLKGFDAVFFVLVLFVIHDSVLKAVALFHRTEGVVGRHLDGAVFVGALLANKVGFRIRRRKHRLGALGEEDGVLHLLGQRHAVKPRQQDVSVHAGEGVGVHGTAAGQRLPDDDNGAGVAIGKRIASAHGVEVGGEAADVVPRNHTAVAAAKAFVCHGEGDSLIHLEQRHPRIARIVLKFAHDAVVAALNDFFADADVGEFFFPEHLHVCVHFGFSGFEEGIGARFAFIVVKGCVAVDTFPLFPEVLCGGVVDVFGITDGLVAQRLPAGYCAEVLGEGFGVFDGIDYHGVGVPASEVAGVHKVGHEPISVFTPQIGIEAAFRVFNVVAELECGSDIAEERAAGGGAASERSQSDAVSGVGFGLCPRGADEVAEIASDAGIVFEDVSDFGYALARHAFVATDDEDEFFGLHYP